MKTLTKQIKHRIYTVSVDVESNCITIRRGRETGLVASNPIFTEGKSKFSAKTFELTKTYRGVENNQGFKVSNEEAEKLVLDAVFDKLKVSEPKLQRVRVPRAKGEKC